MPSSGPGARARLGVVALLDPLPDVRVLVAAGLVAGAELVLGQGRLLLLRSHVDPDQAAPLRRRVSRRLDLLLEVRLRRLRGHVDAVAFRVELPAVVDAAQAALLVAAEEEAGAPVRAGLRDEADAAVRVAEGDEILAQDADADGRAVRRRQLGRQEQRQPEAAEERAHGRAGAGAGEKLVVLGA